jgi:hypothetical protein
VHSAKLRFPFRWLIWRKKNVFALLLIREFFPAGVGGLVINDKREVLVIKEKNGPAKGIWKIPGFFFFFFLFLVQFVTEKFQLTHQNKKQRWFC